MQTLLRQVGWISLLLHVTLTVADAQNYSECQAPDAHQNPKCNGAMRPSPPDASLQVGGSYSVEGTTPAGGTYSGSVTITGDATSGFRFEWKIANDEYSGTGRLEGHTLTVDWGAPEPIVYKVLDSGARLEGRWGKKGRGREKLVRQ